MHAKVHPDACLAPISIQMLLTVMVATVLLLLGHHGSVCYEFSWGPCILQYLEPCTEHVIQYYLFTSDRPDSAPTVLSVKRPLIPAWLRLNGYANKVIVHGYGGNAEFFATKAIRDAYLAKNQTNVLLVDWGKLAMLPCYPTAVINTRQSGECLGKFLIKFSKNFASNAEFQKMHMIGFSLGAHVASYASNIVKHKTGVMFDRITGLDPALPFFTTVDHRSKLDKSDARFVDVIHTNVGVFGKIEPSGHIDFYVNGGQTQLACEGGNNVPLCSHMMSTVYFAESINSANGFWGARCSSYLQYVFGWCRFRAVRRANEYLMGEPCSSESRGIIFLDTSSSPPFALGNSSSDNS